MRIGRRSAAAGIGGINDVVMHESRIVDELDNRRQADGHRRNGTQHLRRQQEQCWPEALATGVQKVFTNFRNRGNVGPHISQKLIFDKRELRRNELINVLRSHLHTASVVYDDLTVNSLSKLAEVW